MDRHQRRGWARKRKAVRCLSRCLMRRLLSLMSRSMGAGVGFLVAVEDRVRELERLVRSPLIEPPLVQRLADSVRAQLSRREGDASSLVAANEKQGEEMAKLTELLRTIDTVRVDSSHLGRSGACDRDCRMQELKAVNEELQRSAEEKAELSAQLEAERVGPCT